MTYKYVYKIEKLGERLLWLLIQCQSESQRSGTHLEEKAVRPGHRGTSQRRGFSERHLADWVDGRMGRSMAVMLRPLSFNSRSDLIIHSHQIHSIYRGPTLCQAFPEAKRNKTVPLLRGVYSHSGWERRINKHQDLQFNVLSTSASVTEAWAREVSLGPLWLSDDSLSQGGLVWDLWIEFMGLLIRMRKKIHLCF